MHASRSSDCARFGDLNVFSVALLGWINFEGLLSLLLRRLAQPHIWKRLLVEWFSEPLHLNLLSLFVAAFGSLRARFSSTFASASNMPDSPIGFVSVDVDYYWSAIDALKSLVGPPGLYLPRVTMYFDDVGSVTHNP